MSLDCLSSASCLRAFLCIIFRRGFLLGRQPCRPIWCSVRRMVWALTGWAPHPFNLCSNAGSTHKSIYQTQTLDMTLSKFTQLFWSTVARPVLSWTCPVKPLYGLGHRAAAQFQGLCNLLIAYASGSQPRSWRTPNTAHFASLLCLTHPFQVLESLQMSWWSKSGVFD